MDSFKFIHAADLHIDAPFKGISKALQQDANSVDVLKKLEKATFTALNNLISCCVSNNIDFLILAGDIYNSTDKSLRARLILRDAFLKLKEYNIKVFMVHGNHDPLTEQEKMFSWPDNVIIFDTVYQSFPVKKDDKIISIIHGISHNSVKEERNLSQLFSRSKEYDKVFQIGLLHCALYGSAGKHKNYAPCNLQDLQAANLDYWALGHIHKTIIASQNGGEAKHPYYVYPGSLQGLHSNELGPHGCVLVDVNKGMATPTFIPLAPLQWEEVVIDISTFANINSLEALEVQIESEILRIIDQNTSSYTKDQSINFNPDYYLLSLNITGSSYLDEELKKIGTFEDLCEHLNNKLSQKRCWICQYVLSTSTPIDRASIKDQDNLLGEAFRIGENLRNNEELLSETIETSWAQLLKHKDIRKRLEQPEIEQCKELINEAEQVLFSLLGGEEWK